MRSSTASSPSTFQPAAARVLELSAGGEAQFAAGASHHPSPFSRQADQIHPVDVHQLFADLGRQPRPAILVEDVYLAGARARTHR